MINCAASSQTLLELKKSRNLRKRIEHFLRVCVEEIGDLKMEEDVKEEEKEVGAREEDGEVEREEGVHGEEDGGEEEERRKMMEGEGDVKGDENDMQIATSPWRCWIKNHHAWM